MADHSKIQWTEATWNVATGCTKISEGCLNCYIPTTPPFRMAGRKFDREEIGGATDIQLHPERLGLPLQWRKPRMVFVNSLADLFHAAIPDEFIVEVFAHMWWAPQHTFQVLTKRHNRMRSLMPRVEESLRRREADLALVDCPTQLTWPLPNVWLGVSVETQRWANVRIPALLDTPAAVRWISAEPLLGPLDLHNVRCINALHPDWCGGPGGGTGAPHPLVNWVVCGGESGKGARPMSLEWAASIVEQCQNSEVPVFVKQLGSEWAKDTFERGRSVAAWGDRKGGNWDYWPGDLRVREFPQEVSLLG